MLWITCLLAVRNQRILTAWDTRQADRARRAAAGLPPCTRRRRCQFCCQWTTCSVGMSRLSRIVNVAVTSAPIPWPLPGVDRCQLAWQQFWQLVAFVQRQRRSGLADPGGS